MNYRVIGIMLGFLISANVNAAIKGAFVSTAEDAPVIIDLSANVSSEASFSYVTVSINPVSGSASVSGASQIMYTPNLGFSGATDTFEYSAFDAADTLIGSASVTVGVGIVSLQNQSANNAAAEFTTLLDGACIENAGSPNSLELVDLCTAFFNATDAERLKIANELAPREIAGQNQLSSSMTAEQLDGIRKRLTAIRQGGSTLNPINISFNLNNTNRFSFKDLFLDSKGGGASAEAKNSRLNVYVSGHVGGGDYDPDAGSSDDGYAFTLRGFTAGSDYRLSRQAIVGAALGVSNSSMDIDNNGGGLDVGGTSRIAY